MENTIEHRNLELTQQAGIVVTALATLALAAFKIHKIMHGETPELPSAE